MKNKSALTIYTLLFVCFVYLISIEKVSAQEHGIFELTSDAVFSKVITKENKKKNRDHFYNLAQKLHATAYISNNAVNNIYGKNEIKRLTFSDTKSFGLLNKKNFNEIELITVTLKKVSDLNSVLDLANNKKLSKLKYIFVKCNFKCTKQQIKNFVKINLNSKIRIFYKTEIPS